MNISIIAAIGINNELGKNNNLIWRLPNDLTFFKKTTLDKVVVMGANTYMSIGRPLPKRINIVITHRNIDGVEIYNSIEDFINKYKDYKEEIFIIGGASIYKEFIDLASNLYLTEVEATCKDADTYFPDFNKEEYDKEDLGDNCDDGIKYKHVLYKRRT